MPRILTSLLLYLLMAISVPMAVLSTEGRAPVPHAPIMIEGDSGFVRENGVVSGSGSLVDPYVIEGWEITGVAGSAMTITGTSAYFVIRNVWIHNTRNGILFVDVVNGRIEDSTISNTGDVRLIPTGSAIRLARSSQNRILHNQILGNVRGIEIGHGSSNVVEDNIVKSNLAVGILVGGGSGNIIRNNRISDNAAGDGPGGNGWGVGIVLVSTDNIVMGNFISENDIGMDLWLADRSVIIQNVIVRNEWGVSIQNSADLTIQESLFFANGYVGLWILGGWNVTVLDNVLRDNRSYGLQISADYSRVSGNLVIGGFTGILLATWRSNILENSVLGARVGFWIVGSPRANLIAHNVVHDAPWYSFLVSERGGLNVIRENDEIRDNEVKDSARGIWILSSSNHVVEGNVIRNVVFPIGIFCMSAQQLAGNIIGDNTLVDFGVPLITRPDVCIDTLPNVCFEYPAECAGFSPFFPPPPVWPLEALALSNVATLTTSETPVALLSLETGEVITSLDWGAALQSTVIGRTLLVRNTSDREANVTITHNLPPEFGKLYLLEELVCLWYFPHWCAPSRDVLPQTLTIGAGEEFILELFWKVAKDAPAEPVTFDIVFSQT